MKKTLSVVIGVMLMSSVAYAAVPTVTGFSVPGSAVSPVPVTTFTATDSDGTVVGYMITESSTKPSASASGWSATKPTSYTTSKTGSVTLYAWAKDNAAGVSAAKTASTTLLAGHTHNQSDVVGLTASLGSKADVSALAGKSDLAHDHDALYQKKYANVVVVDFNAAGYNGIIPAIDSITDASETNRYLLKVMPGKYNVENMPLTMKPYIDIDGSGENLTIIDGWGGNGIVRGASNAEIRNLSIIQTYPNNSIPYLYGMVNLNASPKITNVTIDISVGGLADGIQNTTASPILTNVTIKAASTSSRGAHGIFNYNASPVMDNVKIDVSSPGGAIFGIVNEGNSSPIIKNTIITNTANNGALRGIYNAFTPAGSETIIMNTLIKGSGGGSWGIFAYSDVLGKISIDHSTVDVPTAIYNSSAGALFIGNSKIAGEISNTGSLKCIGAYNANYDPIACN